MTLEEIERIEERLKVFREAAETGREVQCWDKIAHSWFNASLHYVTALKIEIRLKPEPRRFWVMLWPDGAKTVYEDEALARYECRDGNKLIELVEVLK